MVRGVGRRACGGMHYIEGARGLGDGIMRALAACARGSPDSGLGFVFLVAVSRERLLRTLFGRMCEKGLHNFRCFRSAPVAEQDGM